MENIHFETLNILCDRLAKEAGGNFTNAATIGPTSTQSLFIVTAGGNNWTFGVNATIVPRWTQDIEVTTTNEVEIVLQQIEVTTEQLVIPIIAYVGIVVNLLVCFLLRWDIKLKLSSRILLYSFFICQMLYLASVAIHLKFKQIHFAKDITVMNYVGIALSTSQMLATWILFLLINESYRSIRYFRKRGKLLSHWNNLAKLAMLVLLVLIYHLPYVPQIRVIMYHLEKNFFSPCSNSIDDHWDLILPKKMEPIDTYYIIYFCFMYIILTYALPYLLIACQDKDVIDLLHWVKNDISLPSDVCAPAQTAYLVTILCNIYLIFSVPKVVIMIFYLFNQPLRYLEDKYHYFYFSNAFGNVATVLWPIMNFYVLLRYNNDVRNQMKTSCGSCFRKITWPIRKRLYLKKKRQSMQCVCKSEEEIEIANLPAMEQF